MHWRRKRSNHSLRTRINKNGYPEFWDASQGRWVLTHRRVAEKKVGGAIFDGYEVHHINKDRRDSRPENLVVLSREKHRRVHAIDREIKRLQAEIPKSTKRRQGWIYGQLRQLRAQKKKIENRRK